MVTNAELESQFKAFSQDYKGAKKTLNLLCEKVNSIETKLEDLPAMRGEFNKLSAIILSKFSTETNFDQDPKFPKSGPSTAPVFPSNSRPFSSTSSVVPSTGQVPPQQTQPNVVFPFKVLVIWKEISLTIHQWSVLMGSLDQQMQIKVLQ